MLGSTLQTLVAWATWRPGFVRLCTPAIHINPARSWWEIRPLVSLKIPGTGFSHVYS